MKMTTSLIEGKQVQRAHTRHWPIMPEILPIMLLSIAQKLSLLCSKLCFQNQDYVLEVTVLLEYISLSWLLY